LTFDLRLSPGADKLLDASAAGKYADRADGAAPPAGTWLLCDEVRLGKTIEAGLVLKEYWCARWPGARIARYSL
jgi:hypothetical protein